MFHTDIHTFIALKQSIMVSFEFTYLHFFRNKDDAEMDMLRRTMGIGFPLKLQMERRAASKVNIPCSIVAV